MQEHSNLFHGYLLLSLNKDVRPEGSIPTPKDDQLPIELVYGTHLLSAIYNFTGLHV